MRGPFFARALRSCSDARGACVSVYVAAVSSVLLFLLLLFTLTVITDLLVTKGNLEVNREQRAVISPWAGLPQVDKQPVVMKYESRGMLPMVARMGGSWLGRRMQTAYRNVAILRSTELCLIAMVCAAAVLAALECLALSLLERSAKAAAMEGASKLRSEIRTQAFRLGGADALGRAGSDPVRLFTESVEQVRRGLCAWWMAWPRAPLMIALLLVLALALQFWIAMSAILLAILLWSLGVWLAGSSKQDQAVLEDRAAKQMAALVEGLRQAPVVAGYQLEDTPGAPFGESLERHRKAALASETRTSNGRPLLRFAVLAGVCVVLGLVGVNVFSDPPRTTVSEAVLLYAALFCAFPPLKQMYELRPTADKADQAAGRIYTYLERVPGVEQTSTASDLPPLAEEIQFQDVTIRNAAGKAVLDHLTVTIPAGRRVAIFGANNDAQIALAGLLPRFYDPTEGRILYDGHDIRLATLRSLRSQTLLVLQHSLLFSASVADNIACGDARFSDVEVRDAAKRVGAYEFIQQLPQGFATTIGEHGVWLDDCERMLIGLARALIRDPAVLIIEEPANALLAEAARRVEQAIASNSEGRTIVLLSPGLMSLRSADQILIVHDGTLHASGSGTHADLVQHNDLYRHLLYLAFNEYRPGAKPRASAAARGESSV